MNCGTNKYYRVILIVLAVILLPAVLVFPTTAQNEKPLLVIDLIYSNYNGTVKTGQDNIIYIEVRNAGNITIHSISFSCLAPKGWIVTFNPANLSSLEAGAYQNIEVDVRPADTGDRNNNITFIAQSNETSQTLNIFMVLESTNRYWLWLGAGLAVLAALIFIYLFRRLNRG